MMKIGVIQKIDVDRPDEIFGGQRVKKNVM